MQQLDIDWTRPADPRPGPLLDHVRAYVGSAGADGHLWHGLPTLLLTTVGRRSGRPVRTPLVYGEDAGRLIVLAAAHGRPDHPAWYGNLTAHPEVRVQVRAAVLPATAYTATPLQRETYGEYMTALWPAYDDYQAAAWPREIPMVIIETLSGPAGGLAPS
ncbi:nitroreductase family deazaflavin-dependent oxidoreductase [Streptomyces sp. NPDC051567]|uniref:nitroreductase family deazaflavin-dependent oxidoreductase n=1 Tax=Streptomyces sp. NPDC051567 TaxID=3365660 RepID=UPI0037AF96A4